MPFDVNVTQPRRRARRSSTARAPRTAASRSTPGTCRSSASQPDELRRIPLEYLSWVELSDGRLDDMDDLVDETVNHRALPGEGEFDLRGYVEACRGPRLRRALGRRGALRGAAQQPDRRDLPAGLRDDRRPIRTREELRVSAPKGVKELDRDRLVWMYDADAADPRVRGAGQAHLRRASGRDPRPHASRRRRRGVDRRVDRDARPRRPVLRDLPLPRLPARARHRPQGDDGRDLRPQGRPLQGHRRLDAPHRRLQRLPRARRGSSRPGSRTRPARPGRRRSASRARSSSASSATAPPSRARSPSR